MTNAIFLRHIVFLVSAGHMCLVFHTFVLYTTFGRLYFWFSLYHTVHSGQYKSLCPYLSNTYWSLNKHHWTVYHSQVLIKDRNTRSMYQSGSLPFW
jgi:hypothetical protein